MSVADEITRIKGNIASAYTAASGKGATMPAEQNSANLAGCIDTITGGGGEPVEKTKFGVTVDAFLGDVNTSGELQPPSWEGELDFNGVKTILENGLYNKFRDVTGITKVSFPSLNEVNNYGIYNAFNGCTGIVSLDLTSLRSIGLYGLSAAFQSCTAITNVDLNLLQSVNNYGLQNAFSGCTALTSVGLDSLSIIRANSLNNAFYNCQQLTVISFPSLKTVSANSFATSALNGAFRSCTGITEIHFRSDMQSQIEATTQYANKWGATNATIYFDL